MKTPQIASQTAPVHVYTTAHAYTTFKGNHILTSESFLIAVPADDGAVCVCVCFFSPPTQETEKLPPSQGPSDNETPDLEAAEGASANALTHLWFLSLVLEYVAN